MNSGTNHARACHSRESGNPEKHWIPDQVRNDKPNKTYVVMYSQRMGRSSKWNALVDRLVALVCAKGRKYADAMRENQNTKGQNLTRKKIF